MIDGSKNPAISIKQEILEGLTEDDLVVRNLEFLQRLDGNLSDIGDHTTHTTKDQLEYSESVLRNKRLSTRGYAESSLVVVCQHSPSRIHDDVRALLFQLPGQCDRVCDGLYGRVIPVDQWVGHQRVVKIKHHPQSFDWQGRRRNTRDMRDMGTAGQGKIYR